LIRGLVRGSSPANSTKQFLSEDFPDVGKTHAPKCEIALCTTVLFSSALLAPSEAKTPMKDIAVPDRVTVPALA